MAFRHAGPGVTEAYTDKTWNYLELAKQIAMKAS